MDINYFENEFYKIKISENINNSQYYFYEEDNNIYIKRIDSNTGWSNNLNLIVKYKILNSENILNIGSSIENIKKIDIIYLEKNNSNIIHYENDIFKIFYISDIYNDIFKISYDDNTNTLNVKRIDNVNDIGWGQDLKLKYIEKKNNKIKIIDIGSSKVSDLNIIINIDKLKYRELNNFFKSDYCIISIFENNYNDLFNICYYEENNTIYVKRVDKNEGWGQILKLNFFDIKQNDTFIIYIGSSTNNEIYKKIDIVKRKCFVSLTTIPSRIKLPVFIENINHFLNNQSYPIENLFITISKNYKRFEETISPGMIDTLKNIPKVIVILIENDYGPSSKYMGPLLNYYDTIKDNLLIIIDDDRKYNKNLVRNFVIGYNSFPNIIFSSGLWKEYFEKKYRNMSDNFLEFQLYKEQNNNKFYFGQGLGGFFGFCMKIINFQSFIDYNLTILNRIDKSFYHDEGIILGYLKYNQEIILYCKHFGCNFIKEELVDSLCNSNLCNRGELEKEILQLTNLECLL